jgi:hypothetical protein
MSFQRSIQKEAVYGDAAIFDSEHGVIVDERSGKIGSAALL